MITYREARASDVRAIAALHAKSWQIAYRGILEDDFLAGPVLDDRQAVWEKRYAEPNPQQFTLLAEEEGKLIGFACTFLDHDPQWGAILDNLHVDPAGQGKGVGRALIKKSAAWVKQEAPGSPFFLWVFTKNVKATRLYLHLGGKNVEEKPLDGPGGFSPAYRMVWEDPQVLVDEAS